MKGISMRELAQSLGVSVASVSVALRGKPGISEETRIRILTEARKSGYDMNRLSAESSKGSIEIVDYTFYDSLKELGYTHPYYYQFIDSASLGIMQQGYSFAGLYSPLSPNFKNRPQVTGSILIGAPDSPTEWEAWKSSGIPFVISATMDYEPVTTVAHDHFFSIWTGIKHLMSLGHHHIGYVRSINGLIGDARYQAYKTCMESYGLSQAEKLNVTISLITPDYEDALRQFDSIFDRHIPTATAFICDSDYISISLMRALRDHGLVPGQDISVVGFDDLPVSSMQEPPLTTIHPYEPSLAMACVEQLVFSIEHPGSLFRHVRIGTDLVVRGSTGPCPKNSSRTHV